MVDDQALLYTIEGLAAAVIMLVTAFLVLSTTSLYTPGDTHIADMQLQQLGNDVLTVMDTPNSPSNPSNLELYIQDIDLYAPAFRNEFLSYANKTTDGRVDKLNLSASIVYGNGTRVIFPNNDVYYRENTVNVSRLVRKDNTASGSPTQTILLEVLLWRP